MQRLAAASWTVSICALVGCFGNPAILGVGEEEGNGDGGSDGGSDAGNDGFSDSGGPGGDDGSDGGDETGGAPACMAPDTFGPTRAATLTAAQYDSTVADLTGAVGPFASGQPDLLHVGPFGLGMEAATASSLAPAVAAAVDLDALLPCDPATTNEAEQQQCFDAFTPAFARLAWRRSVSIPGDIGAQINAFEGAGDFPTRMRAVIATVLADPEFITLARTGTPTEGDETLIVLDAHALATRLAMFLWNSGPDEELLDLADSGELLDPAVLRTQAERLLADARAERMVDDFTAHWLDIAELWQVLVHQGAESYWGKDPGLFPQYDADLAQAMLQATQAFARSVVLDGSGRLDDLFTLPRSFANDDLAAIYGVDIVGPLPTGSTLAAVDLDPAHRGGLLTEPSFLTKHSWDDQIGCSQRGKAIRQNLLCQPIPPPPPDVDPTPQQPADGQSHKESCEVHQADPTCSGCHALIDPLTFAFDNYDPIGRWIDEIGGVAVDPSGSASDFTFANHTELIDQLLASEEFTQCTVRQYARYALDREPDATDACTLDALEQALADSDGNVRALALAIVDSDAFRVARTPE